MCLENANSQLDDRIETEVGSEMIKKFNCSPPFWSKTSNNSSPGDDECKLNKWNLDQLAEFQDTFAGSYLINPRMLRKSVLDLWALISSGAVLF